MSDGDDETEPDVPTDPVGSFFDLWGTLKEGARELAAPSPDGRPAELWVRWKSYPSEEGEPPIIEITACTVKKLEAPLAQDEHESSFS